MKPIHPGFLTLILLFILIVSVACGGESEEENIALESTPAQTATNTSTPEPATATLVAETVAEDTPTSVPTATAQPTETATLVPTATPTEIPEPTVIPTPLIRQVTTGNCCTNPYWYSNSEIRFIDQDPDTGETGVWAVDISGPQPERTFVTDRLGFTSPDGRYFAYPDRATGLAVIEDSETGEDYRLDLGESSVNFTPDSQSILVIDVDQDLPFEERIAEFWLLDVNGDNPRLILSRPRVSALAWLDDETLLISISSGDEGSSRFAIDRTTIARLSVVDGEIVELFEAPRMRGLIINESGNRLVYHSTFNDEPEDDGFWQVDLSAAAPEPQPLPFMGAYQWWDDHTLLYIPFDLEAASHFFYSYDLATGESQQLTDASQSLITITNNDWTVSPDGNKIALVASKGLAMDGIWVIELRP